MLETLLADGNTNMIKTHIACYGTVLEGQETLADLDDVLPGETLEPPRTT